MKIWRKKKDHGGFIKQNYLAANQFIIMMFLLTKLCAICVISVSFVQIYPHAGPKFFSIPCSLLVNEDIQYQEFIESPIQ